MHHLARLLRREVLDSMRLHRLMAPAFSLVSLPPGVRLRVVVVDLVFSFFGFVVVISNNPCGRNTSCFPGSLPLISSKYYKGYYFTKIEHILVSN
jgi:hypothetical protein